MKQITHKLIKGLMVLLVITSAITTSCKKDDDEDQDQSADYVGQWRSDLIEASEDFQENKHLLTLKVNSFDNLIQTQNSAGIWVNSIQIKGTMVVDSNKMNIHVSEIGTSIDQITGNFTGNMVSYSENSPFFGYIMTLIDQDVDFQSEYSIDGNKLTLKTHTNEDDDYNDLNESIVYTRQ